MTYSRNTSQILHPVARAIICDYLCDVIYSFIYAVCDFSWIGPQYLQLVYVTESNSPLFCSCSFDDVYEQMSVEDDVWNDWKLSVSFHFCIVDIAMLIHGVCNVFFVVNFCTLAGVSLCDCASGVFSCEVYIVIFVLSLWNQIWWQNKHSLLCV